MKYKNIINFIYDLTNKGIKIYVLNENIKLKIPENISFSQEDKVFITQNKQDIIDILKELLPSASSTIDIATWKQNCYDAMNDDFNTPILIAHLFEGIKFVNLINDGKETLTAADLKILSETLNTFTFDVIGVKDEKYAADKSDKLEGVVEMLIGMRNEARANKNFALSDQIRDQLLALGIQLKDGKDGTTFTV